MRKLARILALGMVTSVTAYSATTAAAGITVGPANTNFVLLGTNYTFATGGLVFQCTGITATGTVPQIPTSLTGEIVIPVLFAYGAAAGGTCVVYIGGSPFPFSMTSLDVTPGSDSLAFTQSHGARIDLAADMTVLAIPAFNNCTTVLAGSPLAATLIGTLSMSTGVQVTNEWVNVLSDGCDIVAGTPQVSFSLTLYQNTGTMLAPTEGSLLLFTVTELS